MAQSRPPSTSSNHQGPAGLSGSCGWGAGLTHLPDLLQPVVIFKEEGQVHEGHVHFTVAPKLPVLLHSISSSRKCMLVDLCQQTPARVPHCPWTPARARRVGVTLVTHGEEQESRCFDPCTHSPLPRVTEQPGKQSRLG